MTRTSTKTWLSCVNNVVNVPMLICTSRVVWTKTPFTINYELVLMDCTRQPYDNAKFLTIFLQFNVVLPITKSARNINSASSKIPTKYRLYIWFLKNISYFGCWSAANLCPSTLCVDCGQKSDLFNKTSKIPGKLRVHDLISVTFELLLIH